jgi:hypothetical protein
MEMLIAIAVAAWVIAVIVIARVCGFNGEDSSCPVERAK